LLFASSSPKIDPPDKTKASVPDQNNSDSSDAALAKFTSDIGDLKNSILDTFSDFDDTGNTIAQSGKFDTLLPVIDLTIDELLSGDLETGSNNFYKLALEYVALVEAFNFDLTDELNLSKIGSLPGIDIPDFSLNNPAHKDSLKNLIQSNFRTTLLPDWDIGLFLPEIWSLLDEDFRIDDYLSTFQLLLGLPYVPRMDEVRSDLKSYFDSCLTLQGFVDCIRIAGSNDAQLRTSGTGKNIPTTENDTSGLVRVNEKHNDAGDAAGELPGSVPGIPKSNDDFDARAERVFHGLDPPSDAELIPAALSQGSTQSQERIREVVFIDSRVPDQEILVDSILSKDSSAITILIIDPDKDGIDQITEALFAYRDIEAIHIISHGQSGAIRLGDSLVNSETLTEKATTLKSWSSFLQPGADILLYGCSVAAGKSGEHFLELLHRLTSADVAASDDATGNGRMGGDWDLEVCAGNIDDNFLPWKIADSNYQGLLSEKTIQDPHFVDEDFYIEAGVTKIDLGGTTGNLSVVFSNTGKLEKIKKDNQEITGPNGDPIDNVKTVKGSTKDVKITLNFSEYNGGNVNNPGNLFLWLYRKPK